MYCDVLATKFGGEPADGQAYNVRGFGDDAHRYKLLELLFPGEEKNTAVESSVVIGNSGLCFRLNSGRTTLSYWRG